MKSKNKPKHKGKETDSNPRLTIAETDAVESYSHQYNSDSQFQNADQKWTSRTFYLGLAGLVVGTITLVVFYLQLSTMQRQTRQEQRAWVFMQANEGTHAQAGDPIITKFVITNSGNTPAEGVTVELVVQRIENGKSPAFDYNVPLTQTTYGMLLPKSPEVVFATSLRALPDSTSTEDILTGPEKNELDAQVKFIVIYGRVMYTDVFGVKHTTRVCTYAMPSNVPFTVSARTCSDYNGADNN